MAYKFYITDMSSIFVCITCEFYLMTNFDNKIVRQLMNDYKPLRLFFKHFNVRTVHGDFRSSLMLCSLD